MFEQNTTSFRMSAVFTGSAFMVDCAVSYCSPALKLVEPFGRKKLYDEVDFPLFSGLLPQFASENAVSSNPQTSYVMLCFAVPARYRSKCLAAAMCALEGSDIAHAG